MLRRFGMWGCVVFGCTLVCSCSQEKTEVKGGPSKTVASTLKPTKGPPPALVAKEKTHNFGTMDQQNSDTHVFEIRNEGQGDLQLRLIDSSCGCTVVRLADLVWNKKEYPTAPATVITVKPADAVELEMTWNTELRSGEFKTVTTIETDDPTQKHTEFTVEGVIVPYVELSQANLKFDDARNNEVTTGNLFVFSKKLDNLEITEVKSSNPLITADFEPASEAFLSAKEAQSGLKANIKIEPGLPIGPFSAVLTFKTNCEERPEVSVTVGGQVGGDLYMTPADRISFGTVKATESTMQRMFLTFRSESDAPVEMQEPKVTLRRVDLRLDTDTSAEAAAGIEVPNFLKVTREKLETGKNRFQLKVEVPPGAPGGQFRGLIELETNHPTAKLVKIPVSAQVTR